ncbi:MAG: DUF4252 domain-containing protein [Bacteroidales bacterium]|nr:DUF4252 domain-containing protein [Bacteroidales bacterium]
MKRLTIILVLILLTICSFAQTAKDIYQKYSDSENVSAVYISPAMFRMIGKIPDLQVKGDTVNLASIIQNMSGMYLIDSENSAINSSIKADVGKFVASGKYELLMEAKDSGQVVRMYTEGSDTHVTSFVMISVEDNETTFICLNGNINRSDLDNLLANKVK